MNKEFNFNESINQASALENYNLFSGDKPLKNALNVNNGDWLNNKLETFGEILGKAETIELGNLANSFTPILKTHDRHGNRIDTVDFHSAYHELMTLGIGNECHSLPWTNPKKGAYAARAALTYLRHQIDEGTSCPITMTFAVVPSLKIDESIAKEWLPRIYSTEYDARFIPYFDKKGVTFGMGMTEPQGGSDVRVITSFAKKINQNGEYEITGRKWFCSAPMSDAFLILAQSDKGLSCFLLPRFRPDGSKNAFHIQRLKNKLGNRSNASSEVEFHGAWAQIIGEEGRGVANIMEMVRHTRLDCAIGSAGTLRKAVTEAINHCSQREAFGKLLLEQPLMKNVLADLALESEAATAVAFRLSQAFDNSNDNIQERNFARIATAIGKFWITKRAINAVAEAMECIGGNGYVEESIMPRLYRDVPVNSIWEGSGNVQCLDVLRSLEKEPESIEALMTELNASKKLNENYDRFLKNIEKELFDKSALELRARRIVEKLALALQACTLLKTTPEFVANSFCNARLTDEMHLSFGTLSDSKNIDSLIERANPYRY